MKMTPWLQTRLTFPSIMSLLRKFMFVIESTGFAALGEVMRFPNINAWIIVSAVT